MNPTQTEHKTDHAAQKPGVKQRLVTFWVDNAVGDLLYRIGFWFEYVLVCLARKVKVVAHGAVVTVRNLLLMILRPFLLGVLTLLEDLLSPFLHIASGFRHIRDLPQTLEEQSDTELQPKDIRIAKIEYFFRGVKRYLPTVWVAGTYFLPALAAAVLVVVVRRGLGLQFVLNVQVNGESVGYVATEQVFEKARDDVQGRILTAERLLQGTDDAQTEWDVNPTFTLAVADQTMTEREIANAILKTASDEIVNATAVYIDDELQFVTTEGDHLRSYLENIKAPYEDSMDTSVTTGFVHDIRMVDGVFLQKSVSSYADVIQALNAGAGLTKYTAKDGDTVQDVVDATGVSFDSLAQINPELLTLDQEIPAGTTLVTGAVNADLLQVKVVRHDTETIPVAYETENSTSSEYAYGKVVVVQDGVEGTADITYETTYIDGVPVDRQAVDYKVITQPVNKITITGTKLKTGMVAQVGSGSFMWPVPGYSYVSRWASLPGGHRGADICAPYGTPILAADSGSVVAAGWHWSYGNYVEIDHGNGYRTLYAHMSSIGVTQGQAVSQGQEIGKVGSTGNSTGNHCHFEVYSGGTLISARQFFPGM